MGEGEKSRERPDSEEEKGDEQTRVGKPKGRERGELSTMGRPRGGETGVRDERGRI